MTTISKYAETAAAVADAVTPETAERDTKTIRSLRDAYVNDVARNHYTGWTAADLRAEADRRGVKVKAKAARAEALAVVAEAVVAADTAFAEAAARIEEVWAVVRHDRYVRQAALIALADWQRGVDNGHEGRSAPAEMRAAWLAALTDLGNAYTLIRDTQDVDEDEALARLTRHVMGSGVMGNATGNLSSVYQVRVGDLAVHMARQAAHVYALGILAPAAFGSEAADRFGINAGTYWGAL